ncbi:hypothetical protein OJ996_25860 [Luteolibacter sp. GHJ8]|uniref:Uncharacterized protein n=1 Tax=Luteolibacter rhizosphaerae TaxID=2989719 RepID=A0ABT3GBL6_9BACT|nr:hypothetical protein [Luteolibacter rhizosphaerae]MCW1917042.1 hypothetical protein [Luteolibacter rhizosphaerae]
MDRIDILYSQHQSSTMAAPFDKYHPMRYWRMQLHPCDSSRATQYACRSLCAGYIGLDFLTEAGDLLSDATREIETGQSDYVAFATQMAIGDRVLIMAHHFPLAVCTVAGEYNYIRHTSEDLGIWFRHFRRVEQVIFYGDAATNAHSWPRIVMTDTISPLHDPNSQSYRLIESLTNTEGSEAAPAEPTA